MDELTLEKQIAADAKTCAKNFWWRAHDERKYKLSGEEFAAAENTIAKYSGNEMQFRQAAEYFSTALRNYDKFTEKLKGGNDTKELEDNLLNSFADVYNALGVNSSVAQCTARWWTYFARMKIADAKGLAATSEMCFEKMIQNIISEHKLRFPKLDSDEARGLASLLVGAGMLGHSKRNWAKSKELLEKYYFELFTILASRN